jgi:hypothetical protein
MAHSVVAGAELFIGSGLVGLEMVLRLPLQLRVWEYFRSQKSEYARHRLRSNAVLAWAELCSRLQLGGCQTGYYQSTTWTLELPVERCSYEDVGRESHLRLDTHTIHEDASVHQDTPSQSCDDNPRELM